MKSMRGQSSKKRTGKSNTNYLSKRDRSNAMAYVSMEVAPADGPEKINAYEYTEELIIAGNGAWILIPRDISVITAMLEVVAGSGSIEVTNDTVYNVKINLATGITWDDGTVVADTQSAIMPVTAVRQVNVSGTTTIKLRAQ